MGLKKKAHDIAIEEAEKKSAENSQLLVVNSEKNDDVTVTPVTNVVGPNQVKVNYQGVNKTVTYIGDRPITNEMNIVVLPGGNFAIG